MATKNIWDWNAFTAQTNPQTTSTGLFTTSSYVPPPVLPSPPVVPPPPTAPPANATPDTPTTAPTYTAPPPAPPSYGDYVQWEYKTVFNPTTGVPEIWRRKPAGTITDKNDRNYGKPILAGAWEKDPDAKDYTDLYNQIRSLPGAMEERGLSNFQDWLTYNGQTLGDTSPFLAYLADLKAKLDGGQAAADELAAWESAAQGMGLTGEQLSNILGTLTLKMSGNTTETANMTPAEREAYFALNPEAEQGIIASQQGLSAQEIALRERMQRSQQKIQTEAFGKMLDNALGSSNSRSRYLMQADQYLTQIRDQELQYALAVSQEDAARRNEEYQATLQSWGSMYQAGQMGKQQFLENIRQNRSLELQITMSEISTVFAQNQEYLQQYNADLQAFNLYSQNLVNAITTEMGMDQAVLDYTSALYDQALAPYLASMVEWEAQMSLYQQDYQRFVDTELTPYLTEQTNSASAGSAALSGVIEVVGALLGLFFGAIL